MSDLVFNIAKGRAAELAFLPASSDRLVLVPLNASALPSDATLRQCETLAAVLSAGATEHTAGRINVTTTTRTIDHSNSRVDVDFDDQSWASVSGDPMGAIVVCYDPTGSAANSALIPLTKHDFAVTPNGTNILVQVATGGFYRAS